MCGREKQRLDPFVPWIHVSPDPVKVFDSHILRTSSVLVMLPFRSFDLHCLTFLIALLRSELPGEAEWGAHGGGLRPIRIPAAHSCGGSCAMPQYVYLRRLVVCEVVCPPSHPEPLK